MKFKNVCGTAECNDKENNKGCLVDLPLFLGQIPASDLIGRMCLRCGEVQIVDQFGNIVSGIIPGLTVVMSLCKHGILTGDMVSLDIYSGKARLIKERGEDVLEFPAKGLEVKLSCYKEGVLRGAVHEAFVSIENGTIGGIIPHLFYFV